MTFVTDPLQSSTTVTVHIPRTQATSTTICKTALVATKVISLTPV